MSETKKIKEKSDNSSIPASHKEEYGVLYIAFGIITTGGLLLAITQYYLTHHQKLGLFKIPKLPTTADRLAYALQLQVLSLVPFFLSLNHVTHIRLTNSKARNPLAGNEHLVERANRVLRNTTEQLIFSFINITAFSTLAPAKYLCLLPLLVAFFVFGRLLFAAGYLLGHPKHRVYGVVMTMLPTVVLFHYNLVKVVGGLFNY